MGDDAAIVQSARVSYGKGTKTVSQDSALISYLIRHRHTTPKDFADLDGVCVRLDDLLLQIPNQ